jgi:nitrite reductase/ring-hydroxylating ferredoxin subunit
MWTPVAQAKALADKPLQVNFWGARVVLWRTEGDSVAALRDACGHRGIPLSKGEVVGGAIRCGYHHFCFDAQGRCVQTPAVLKLGGDYRARCNVQPFFVKEAWGLLWLSVEPESANPFPVFGDAGASVTSKTLPVEGHFAAWLDHQIDWVHMFFPHASSLFGVRPGEIERDGTAMRIVNMTIDPSWRGSLRIDGLRNYSSWIRAMQAGGPLRALTKLLRMIVNRRTPGCDLVEMAAEMLAPTMQKLDIEISGPFGVKRFQFITALNPIAEGRTNITFLIFVHRPMRGLLGLFERRYAAARATRMHVTGEDLDFLSGAAAADLNGFALTPHDAFVLRNRWTLRRYLERCRDAFPPESLADRIAATLGDIPAEPVPPVGDVATSRDL